MGTGARDGEHTHGDERRSMGRWRSLDWGMVRGPALLLGYTLLAVSATSLHAQTVVVRGSVVEPANATRIGGAAVELSGVGRASTDANGEFLFPRVTPGRHAISVRALGYTPWETTLDIRADTTLVIELAVDPVHLDSLRVAGGTITVEGVVTGADTGRRIVGALVFVGEDEQTETSLSGRFDVGDVPVGLAIAVDVRALEYLPARIALITGRDTTLSIALVPDPISRRMVELQMERLHVRSRTVGNSRIELDREALLRTPSWSAYDVVVRRLGRSNPIRCLVIDEVPIRLTPGFIHGDDLLGSWLTEEIQHIEIFGRGAMVRVYTREFMERLVQNDAELDRTLDLPGCF